MHVTSVSVSVAVGREGAWAPPRAPATPPTTLITGSPLAINAEVLADDSSTWSGPRSRFVNKATNQDGCKGATVNLAYSAI